MSSLSLHAWSVWLFGGGLLDRLRLKGWRWPSRWGPEPQQQQQEQQAGSAPLCRVTAPLSFQGHHAFMDACARHVILRYAIVACLAAAMGGATLAAGAAAGGGGGGGGVVGGSFGWSVAGSRQLASGPTIRAPSPLISLASCPTLPTATPAYTRPSSDPFSANASWSFFPPPSRVSLHHAHWRVHYWDTWKLLENELAGQQYQLVFRGADPASVPTLYEGQVLPPPHPSEGAGGAPEHPIVIRAGLRRFMVPVVRLCVEETVGIAFVEMLGVRQQIRLLGQYSTPTSACVQQLQLGEFESEYGNLTLRAEQVDAHCDLVLGSNDAGPPHEHQHVSFATTAESHLLGRSEWLQFVAAFVNREMAAKAIVGGIQTRYNHTASLVRRAQEAHPSVPLPVVAWISVYAGTYTVSTAAFKECYTDDAGGQLFKPAVTFFSNVDDFLAVLASGSISAVVDETYAPDPRQYTMDTFLDGFHLRSSDAYNASALPFLARAQVYRYDGLVAEGSLALDWFENALPNADALLADLASLLANAFSPAPHPSLTNHTGVWLRNLARGDGVRYTPTACPSQEAPLPAIEAAEGAPEDDPAMVTHCPRVLMEPWTWGESEPQPPAPDAPSQGMSAGEVGLVVALVLLAVGGGLAVGIGRARARARDRALKEQRTPHTVAETQTDTHSSTRTHVHDYGMQQLTTALIDTSQHSDKV